MCWSSELTTACLNFEKGGKTSFCDVDGFSIDYLLSKVTVLCNVRNTGLYVVDKQLMKIAVAVMCYFLDPF